jgi:hypothetical protein
MNNGFIQLHRALLEWEWWSKPITLKVFLYCLLKANHKDKNYQGKLIKRGSFLTGRELIAKDCNVSVQQIRTALNHLKSTNELTIKSSGQGTVIQVVKYCNYQGVTNKSTNDQPTINQRVTTNNNDNKDNKNIHRSFGHLKLSVNDYEKLKEIYTESDIELVLNQIENFKGNKNYKSLYLTSLNWLKKSKTEIKVKKDKMPMSEWLQKQYGA